MGQSSSLVNKLDFDYKRLEDKYNTLAELNEEQRKTIVKLRQEKQELLDRIKELEKKLPDL